MDADRAKSVIAGTRFSSLDWVASTDSTNADLIAAARNGADQRVLVADHQLAGRGRLGRVWEAPSGASLLCSMLVRAQLPPSRLHFVTTAVGLGALDACRSVAGIDLGLKWPNDLVAVGAHLDRKVGGILAETTATAGRIDAVVVGIGINVNWPEELPAELAEIATSLRHLGGVEVDRESLVEALVRRTDHWLALIESGNVEALSGEYRRVSATIGRDVRVELPTSELWGRATDVDATGALHLIDEAGIDHAVDVGDVVHLRPQP